MDLQSLTRLATDGLTSVTALREIESWCWDQSEASGDARFCSIARALQNIADVWDRLGAFPKAIMSDLEETIRLHLPSILLVERPDEASGLARILRDDVSRLLGSWDGRLG